MARPKVDIDWEQVGQSLIADCKTVDIAAQHGISTRTLYQRCKQDLGIRFSALSQQKKAHGDNLLRAKQYEMAVNGNTVMAIFLGKQRLGQKDQNEIGITVDVAKLSDEELETLIAKYRAGRT